MKMEFDITKMVEEMAIQAKENQEEFIFETIRPYCENVLQIKINKEELKQILLNGMQKQQPCEDAISREAAIEAVIDLCKYYTPTKSVNHPHMDFVIEELQNLPSVTPQQPCEDWYDVPSDEMTLEQAKQAVKDLRKWLAKYLWQDPCEDAVSREAVLKLFNESDNYRWETTWIRRKIEKLPSVTPTIPEVENNYNIGYNCGYADAMSDVADMRGDEE